MPSNEESVSVFVWNNSEFKMRPPTFTGLVVGFEGLVARVRAYALLLLDYSPRIWLQLRTVPRCVDGCFVGNLEIRVGHGDHGMRAEKVKHNPGRRGDWVD